MRTMSSKTIVPSNKEALIQRWQCQLIDRTHISFHELLHLLRQHVWITSHISFLLFFILIFTKDDPLFYNFLRFSFCSQLLLETLFCLFDRDSSGLLSESEWVGSVYKVGRVCVHDFFVFYFVSTNIWYRISNRTKDVRTLEPFICAFRHVSRGYDSLSLADFFILFEDSSVCILLKKHQNFICLFSSNEILLYYLLAKQVYWV